ncbi:hypothetical protein [Rhodobacteraceae phage LS06-2018-MD06]|nr:hypothetical protein [Rhodobacteraceae phage LS06-2018-MD06]
MYFLIDYSIMYFFFICVFKSVHFRVGLVFALII